MKRKAESESGPSTPTPQPALTEYCRTLGWMEHQNIKVVRKIGERMWPNSTTDLTEFLRETSKTYANKRQRLDQEARNANRRRVEEEAAVTVSVSSRTDQEDAKSDEITDSAVCRYSLRHELIKHLGAWKPSLEEAFSSMLTAEKGEISHLNSDRRTVIRALNEGMLEGEILSENSKRTIVGLGPSVAVKITDVPDDDQIQTLKEIEERVSDFPAPKYLGAVRADRSYVFMTRYRGLGLHKLWKRLEVSQKLSIQQQLNAIFGRLREVPHKLSNEEAPKAGVSVSEAASPPLGTGVPRHCKVVRPGSSTGHESPYEISTEFQISAEAQFNDFLTTRPKGMYASWAQSTKTWIENIRASMPDDHAIVFTHGNLHPGNIRVTFSDDDEDKITVTDIVGWGAGGWYPEYWEFVRGMGSVLGDREYRFHDWYNYLPTEAIGVWSREYATEQLIDRWFTERWY